MSFETEITKLETEMAGLYGPDGHPKYGEAEHAGRVAGLTRQIQETFADLDAGLKAKVKEIRAEINNLQNGSPSDPLLSLSADELSRANGLKTFLTEDAEKLSPPELKTRLEAVAEAGDRAAAVVFYRAVATRTDGAAGLRSILSDLIFPGNNAEKIKALRERHTQIMLQRAEAEKRMRPHQARRVAARL